MKAIIYKAEDLGAEMEITDIPADLIESARAERERMIEVAAEMDDELTNKYLEGHNLSEADIKRGLRLGTLEYRIVPVLAGSALKNKGVQPMLDAVVDYLPSPLDVPPVIG